MSIPHDVGRKRWDEGRQNIINEHEVPPRRSQQDLPGVPVRARIIWERDGPQTITTIAYAWAHWQHRRLILVEVSDPRYRFVGTWLDIADTQKIEDPLL